MTYLVRTAVFEGPLDLLLQLITRHQVDVTQVSLHDVVAEYLLFLDEIRDLDLEVTSEFLLIAATLIQLKAHALLPTRSDLDLDEELALMEERDRILSRLLACVTFKDVAAVLLHRLQENNRYVPRSGGPDIPIATNPPEITTPLDPQGLSLIAHKVLTRPSPELDLDHLDLDLPSVAAAIDEVRQQVAATVTTTFETLVDHCSNPTQVAAYFLALLELARWGVIEVSQRDWLSEIVVVHNPEAPVEFETSEWAT